MTSEDKKVSTTHKQQTASIAPGIVNAEIESPVVKSNGRPTKPGCASGGGLSIAPVPWTGPPAPDETLIDVDTYGDGMAFRFTWR